MFAKKITDDKTTKRKLKSTCDNKIILTEKRVAYQIFALLIN